MENVTWADVLCGARFVEQVMTAVTPAYSGPFIATVRTAPVVVVCPPSTSLECPSLVAVHVIAPSDVKIFSDGVTVTVPPMGTVDAGLNDTERSPPLALCTIEAALDALIQDTRLSPGDDGVIV